MGTEEGKTPELSHSIMMEKMDAAEKNSSVVRTLVALYATITFPFVSKEGVYVEFAWILLAFIWVYCLYVLMYKPYRKFQVFSTIGYISVTDCILIAVWLFASGGIQSTYYVIYYASIVAVAFRFSLRFTMLTAAAYTISYAILLILLKDFRGNEVEFIERTAFIFVMGYFGSLITAETANQAEQKLIMKAWAEKAEKAEEEVRQLNATLEQKVEERAAKLDESQRQFEMMMDTLPQMAWTSGADGNVNYVNPRWVEFIGISSNQMTGGLQLAEYLHPEDREKSVQSWIKAIETGTSFEMENRWLRKDNTYRWMLARALPLKNKDGEVILWVGTCTDIHQKKLSEDYLEQKVEQRTLELMEINKELERSNRDLEQFAYVTSHDLKEPIRMISSYSQLLAERYGKGDGGAKEFAQYINEGVQNINVLIRDLLEYSKVGRKTHQFTAVGPNSVLSTIIYGLKLSIDETDTTINVPRLPIIYGIHVLIVQLFKNILENAIKFRGKSTPVIDIKAVDNGDGFILFSIRDNGIGIHKDFESKIFQIFQRLHTKNQYPGSGIGLAICKRIVELHKGQIWIESEPGKGSTFYFTLPKYEGRDTIDEN